MNIGEKNENSVYDSKGHYEVKFVANDAILTFLIDPPIRVVLCSRGLRFRVTVLMIEFFMPSPNKKRIVLVHVS